MSNIRQIKNLLSGGKNNHASNNQGEIKKNTRTNHRAIVIAIIKPVIIITNVGV